MIVILSIEQRHPIAQVYLYDRGEGGEGRREITEKDIELAEEIMSALRKRNMIEIGYCDLILYDHSFNELDKDIRIA